MGSLSESVQDVNLSRRKYLLPAIVGVALLVALYTVLYNVGMGTLEGEPQPLLRSFQTVVEVMAPSGFGADSPWRTFWMNLLVTVMQASGLAIFVLVVLRITVPLFTED